MLAMGGGVRGGLFGTAASLNPDPAESDAREQRRATCTSKPTSASVYAQVIDNWLGGNSVAVLGANFRVGSLNFV